jgi:hypothetical protein
VLVRDGFGRRCCYARSKSVGHVAGVRGWLKSPSEEWRTSACLLRYNDPAGRETIVQSKRLQRWSIRVSPGPQPDIISNVHITPNIRASRPCHDAWVSTYTAVAAGDFACVTDDVRTVTGNEPESLRQYLQTRH